MRIKYNIPRNDGNWVHSWSIQAMGNAQRRAGLSLEAIAIVALFQAVCAHSAVAIETAQTNERSVFPIRSSAFDPLDRFHVGVTSPSVGNWVSIPVSEGLLPVHHSQICVELKQSKQASIDQLADQAVCHVRPVWPGPTGLRPTFAEPSLQILFCTWLA